MENIINIMNGKNFTAAEKHFFKKQEQYEKSIKYLRKSIMEKEAIITELSKENQELQSNNVQLKDWVKRLLEYTELSKADIKAACDKDKELAKSCEIFGTLMKFLSGEYK